MPALHGRAAPAYFTASSVALHHFLPCLPARGAPPSYRMSNTKGPNIPAWGGGAGSRMAAAAAAKKLQTARDRQLQQGRSASAAGFRPEQPVTAARAASACW